VPAAQDCRWLWIWAPDGLGLSAVLGGAAELWSPGRWLMPCRPARRHGKAEDASSWSLCRW